MRGSQRSATWLGLRPFVPGEGRSWPCRERRLRRTVWRAWDHFLERMGQEVCLAGVVYASLVATWQLQSGSPLGTGDAPGTGGGLKRRSPARVHALGRRHLVRTTAALLDSLGPTPGAVAGSLYLSGVRGGRGAPEEAPLAAFLAVLIAAEPGVQSVSVTPSTVTIVRRSRWRRPVTVPLPSAGVAFAAAFEAGGYSLLARPQ